MCTWKNYRGIAVLFLLLTAPAHASKYDLISAEKVSTAGSDENKDIVVDAMKVNQIFLAPNSVGKKMAELASKEGPNTYRDIQALWCSGTKAKFKSELKIVAVPPTPPPGIPMDKVAAARKRFIDIARRFLKERYLYEFSNTQFSGQSAPINPDYDAYKRYVLDTEGERKFTNRFNVEIPFAPVSTKKNLITFYKQIRNLPSFSAMRWDKLGDTIDHAATNFLFLFLPHENVALLFPKAAATYHAEYGGGNGTEVAGKLAFVSSDTLERSDSLQIFYKSVSYMPSTIGWKIKDLPEAIYPLQFTIAEDLAFLRANYTFIVPVEAANKIFGNIEDQNIEQYVGYSKNGEGKLTHDISLTIENSDFLWRGMLAANTSVTQSDQADGSVSFKVELDTPCKYMVPLADLQSR